MYLASGAPDSLYIVHMIESMGVVQGWSKAPHAGAFVREIKKNDGKKHCEPHSD